MELGELIDKAIEKAVSEKMNAVLGRLSGILGEPLADFEAAAERAAMKAYINLKKGCQLTRAQFDALPKEIRESVPRSKRPGYIKPGIYACKAVTAAEFADVLKANQIGFADENIRFRNCVMLRLCFFGGLRPSSVARVRAGEILYERMVLLLPAASQKNRRPHEVPLPERLCEDLRILTDKRPPDGFIFLADPTKAAAIAARWGDQDYPHLSDGARNQMIQKLKKVLRKELKWSSEKLRFFGWPSLRKGAASVVETRLGVNAARELLDHRSVSTTLRYLATRREDIRAVQLELEKNVDWALRGLTTVERRDIL